MPMRRIPMEKIREVVRLKIDCGLSMRAISRALRISRPVVKEYLSKIESTGLVYQDVRQMSDSDLLEIIEGSRHSSSERYDALKQRFQYISKELKRPGVTRQRLWQEYKVAHPDGYGYSQFCYHFQIWRHTSSISMHIEHKAGDKMFVDFTGKKLQIVDKQTDQIKDVEVFVAVLGASQLTYVEAVASQKKADWIAANQNAFYYFGGVPKAVVPDCLKSAVTNPNRYEPDINPDYADFARHFKSVILPARPNRPKDKALVEGAVRIVYAWIFAAIRDRIFYSLDELNQAIREELKGYNAKKMQKLGMSRQQLFEHIEKDMLLSLPQQTYTRKHFKSLKVQFNYHIYLSDDKHHYSVPYRYRARQVQVIYTDTIVEIFYKNQRIACHKRNRSQNGYSTIKEHMPQQHQKWIDTNPQRLIDWAKDKGKYVSVVIEHILINQKHPQQAYKRCLGIINLHKRFGRERLNKACQRAVECQYYSYKGIKNILDNQLEEVQIDIFDPLPEHSNIRGNQYYR